RPLAAPDRDHDLRRLIERTALDRGATLNVKYEINDPVLNFALVRDGMAFAILPDSAGWELMRGNPEMGVRRIVSPVLSRTQSIVRMAESEPGRAVLAVEQSIDIVLRHLIKEKLLRGRLAPVLSAAA